MATGGFVKRGEQEDPLGAAGTDKITRIFPIDTYDFPPELLSLAVRYHFLRVPMLGQYNPIAKKDDWCGRTAASITWNYYQRAIARIADKSQYIAHWRGPGSAQMDLRYPISGNLAFVNQSGNYNLLDQRASPGTPNPSLEAGLVGWGLVQFPALFGDNLKQSLENPTAFSGVVPPEKRPPRLAEAEAIRKDPEKLRQVLKPVFDALSRNNPVVLNTGLSKDSAYGGHLILVVGFCDLPDDEHGTVWPWLLVANPAPPEIDEGPRCTPATNLRQLHEGKDSIYFVGNPGDWWHAQGYLHLMRASKLFEQNINPQRTHENALWIDDLYNPGRWGGQFLSRKEATPLDPDLVVTKGVVPSLSFPIQDETWAHPDPISYYRLAESAGRGFYPLGVNRLLHGGAHFVGDGSQIIRSMAPGYVVAARIGNARPDKRVNDFVENETGFVLVRHDLELPSAGSLAFYSLYMHLRPTKWPVDKDNAYEEVHWLRRFYLSFYGGIVNLDPNRGPVGQIRWAAANVPTPIPESCKVYAADGKLNVADRFALRAGTRCVGYFKGSGGNLRKGWDALSSHAVVTFSGPLLQVAHGEPLGVTQSDRGNGISGSLHWEVFARADQSPNAVEKMVDLATKELKLAMDPSSPSGTPPPFSISQSDNVLHADKLKAIGAKLLADDPKRFEAEVLEAAKLQGEIDQAAPPANAASQNQALDTLKEKTGVRTLTVDNAYEQLLDRFMATSTFAAAPASSPVNPDVKQPAYSVTLEIDVTTYPVTATSGGAEIKIAFLSAAKAILGTASKPLTQAELQTKNPIRISLMVPAETATLEVKSRFHLDHVAAPGADKDLAAIVLPARFRGLSIEHVSEWSEASLHDLVQHLFQAGRLAGATAEDAWKPLKPVAWYGVARVSGSPPALPAEAPLLGDPGHEPSLFDGKDPMLPAAPQNGPKVRELHPVTALWLLKLLGDAGKCSLATRFEQAVQASTGTAGTPPAFFGWTRDASKPLVVGRALYAFAIRKEWDSGAVTLVAQPDGGSGLPSFELAGEYSEGIFVAPLRRCLWGRWKLEVKGHSNARVDTQGATQIVTEEVLKPELAPTFLPRKNTDTGLYSIDLRFAGGCPDALPGYVTYEYAKISGPTGTDFPEADDWLLDEETGSFVVGLRKGTTQISGWFAASEYLTAQTTHDKLRVSGDLCCTIESFRREWGRGVALISVSADGREAVAAPALDPALAFERSLSRLQTIAGRPNSWNTKLTIAQPTPKTVTVEFQVIRDPAPLQWTPLGGSDVQGTPVLGKPLFEESPFLEKDRFITGLKPNAGNPRVTDHMSWNEYKQVAPAGFRLARDLAEGIESLRGSMNSEPRPDGSGIGISIERLDKEGLNAALRCDHWDDLKDKMKDKARSLFASADFVQIASPRRRGGRIEALDVTATVGTSGVVRCEFDPRSAFARILSQAAPGADERVLVKTRFVAINGDVVEFAEGPSHVIGKVPSSPGPDDEIRAAGEGVFKALVTPGFGRWTAFVEGQSLTARLSLNGSSADWVAAKPTISVGTKPRKLTQAPRKSWALGVTLPLAPVRGDENFVGRSSIDLVASVPPDSTFDDESINIKAASQSLDTRPALKPASLTVEEGPRAGLLTFRAVVHCIPRDGGLLTVKCRKLDTGTEVPLGSHLRNVTVRYRDDATLDADFSAELDGSALQSEENYEFTLAAATRDGRVLGAEVGSLTTTYKTLPPQLRVVPDGPGNQNQTR